MIVSFRASASEYEAIKKAAAEKNCTISNFLRQVVADSFGNNDILTAEPDKDPSVTSEKSKK